MIPENSEIVNIRLDVFSKLFKKSIWAAAQIIPQKIYAK